MFVLLVGISHKTAPVEVREKLSFRKGDVGKALALLKEGGEIREGVILSTCNRVEIYGVSESKETGIARIKGFLSQMVPFLSFDHLDPYLYVRSDQEAVRHLFRVASGLDSMVVGEPQILGQVKEAFDAALLCKGSGPILNKLFKKAISVAKRVRTETGISENAVSVSYAAVELARKIFGDLQDKGVLLLGAGEMAELAAGYLANQGVREVVVSTRNYERAAQLAARFNGRVARFEDFRDEMLRVDIVLCSTGAYSYLIRKTDMEAMIHLRKNRPIFLIDISVPRNIDPAVNEIDNVFLYDIDDLASVVEANLRARQREAQRAEQIIQDEVQVFGRWFKTLEVVPVIVALREKVEQIRKGEMERWLARMSTLPPEVAQQVEMLTTSIVNKIVHHPIVALKDESQGAFYAEVARRLFALQDPSEATQDSPQKQSPTSPTLDSENPTA